MNQKTAHLIQITLIYIVIGISGYLTYRYSGTDNEIMAFGLADIVMTIICFVFSLIKKNSSVYDAYWSVIPFYFVLLWIYIHYDKLEMSHWLIFLTISIWSWRLTLNWVRSWKDFTHEDWRYVMLSEKHGKSYALVNFFGIHLFPSALVFGGMLPLFYIFDQNLNSDWLLYLGLLVSLLGTLIEFNADNQLAKFRTANDRQVEDVLDSGIWAYSRNPNYLGEIMFWLGLFIVGLAYNAPIYTGTGFLAMLLLFVFISIPMKEKRMLERRPGFKEYQEKVAMLVPGVGF